MVKKFNVKFKIAPSQGGQEKTVSEDADNKAEAIVSATLKLSDEGIDRWSLVSAQEATS